MLTCLDTSVLPLSGEGRYVADTVDGLAVWLHGDVKGAGYDS